MDKKWRRTCIVCSPCWWCSTARSLSSAVCVSWDASTYGSILLWLTATLSTQGQVVNQTADDDSIVAMGWTIDSQQHTAVRRFIEIIPWCNHFLSCLTQPFSYFIRLILALPRKLGLAIKPGPFVEPQSTWPQKSSWTKATTFQLTTGPSEFSCLNF